MAGFTQKELADRLGIQHITAEVINEYEEARSFTDLDICYKLSVALGKESGVLFGEVDENMFIPLNESYKLLTYSNAKSFLINNELLHRVNNLSPFDKELIIDLAKNLKNRGENNATNAKE